MRPLQHGSTGFDNFETWRHNPLISQWSVLSGRILGGLRVPAFGAAQFVARGDRLLFALAVVVALGLSDLNAQKPPRILFPYSVVNYSSLPWMIAKDAGLFRKQDLTSIWFLWAPRI